MAWSSVKTEAIVLTVEPAREADRRYRALTPSFGKLDFLGRGAQKGKAKLASHLEPFAIVDIEIIKGRRSTTVISVDRKHAFRGIASNFESRLLANASLSLLDRYTYEQEEDSELYKELTSWLYFLDDSVELKPARSTFLLGGFLLRVLGLLGYTVELQNCLSCKNSVMPLSFRWHSGRGGLVCSDCISKDSQDWFAARNLPEEIIKLLRFARDANYQDLLKPSLAGEEVEQFAQVVQDLLVFHIPARSEIPFWQNVLADYELEMPQETG